MSPLYPLLLSALCVSGLVWAETLGRRGFSWLFKPTAAACFLWLAWIAGAGAGVYGQWLLAGLVACWLGDVLLIPEQEHWFLAGLGSFLLGHLLFAVAFLNLPANPAATLVALPAVALLVFLSLRWLLPHVPKAMKVAVVAYIIVISTMLLCAAALWDHPGGLWIIIGATGFAVSDLAVARQQFVKPARLNRFWGTPLYFASQMLLAWTPALVSVSPQ
jgi:uncharacterized membrane protein YhhN